MLRYLHQLLTQFDDALDWMEDDPLLTPFEPALEMGAGAGAGWPDAPAPPT